MRQSRSCGTLFACRGMSAGRPRARWRKRSNSCSMILPGVQRRDHRANRNRMMAKALFMTTFLAMATSAFAQAPSPTPESAPPAEVQATSSKLDEQQAAVRDRVARLEDRLFQLNQALRKAEPEKAARLMETLGASRSLMIRQKMDEIIKKLQSKEYADAVDKEQIVAADLQALLKGLLEEPDHSGQRKEE